jgi:NAD(P)-dependent dehydrogenase (short-subunit alcohol dehydrogenase family)
MSTASTNPIVVVTGSNTGIGYETVRALIASTTPYTAILCSRDLKKAQDAALKLQSEAKKGSEVIPLQLDIADDNSIEHFVKNVTSKFGRIDILINNAGELDEFVSETYVTMT